MTPDITEQTRDLWRVQGQLAELFEALDEAHDKLTGAYQAARLVCSGTDLDIHPLVVEANEEMKALDSAIRAYVVDKVQRVDEIRAPLLAFRQAAEVCRAEAKRNENAALAWDRKVEAIEALVKLVMQQLSESGYWKPKETRKLASPLGSFTLQNNGGKQPVEITDETLLPDEVCHAEIRMPYRVWKLLKVHLESRRGSKGQTVEEQFSMTVKRAHSLSLIGDALVKPCEECEGIGSKCCEPDEHTRSTDCTERCHTCSYCGGSGTAGVPGARLAPRGDHLRVK